MGQGMRVNSRFGSIIVDIGGEGSLLHIFAVSASLLATMACVASLSLGRSISAHTAVGPALLLLLLLLGEFGVSRLVLYSAKLVGLRALTTTVSSTFLLEREHGSLDDTFWLQVLNLIWGHLAEYLCYYLHSRRELAEDNHCLHWGREVETSVFEIREVAQHLGYRRSRMGASRNGSRKELAQLSIGRTDTRGAETLF